MFENVAVPDVLAGELPHDDPELIEALGLALTEVAFSDTGVVVIDRGDGTAFVGWPSSSIEPIGRLLLDALRRRGLEIDETAA